MSNNGIEYQKNVNALIPKAEMFADEQVLLTDFARLDDYQKAWNTVFHLKMNELAEACGRVRRS
ncbi:MAG: hypothetical protein HQM13_13530 [SAR324 cluster bacterium]|nr:hypothetical protein [SAR324 cluster bacterium]